MPQRRLSLTRSDQRKLKKKSELIRDLVKVSSVASISKLVTNSAIPSISNTKRRILLQTARQPPEVVTFGSANSPGGTASSSQPFLDNNYPGSAYHCAQETLKDGIEGSIKHWAVKHKVSAVALSDLLKILRTHSCFDELPADSRTILKTPRTVPIQPLAGGQYVHFGLESGLRKVIQSSASALHSSTIEIQFNVDGIPLAKSSSQQFWPILCCVNSIPNSRPFAVGIFFGKSKPSSSKEFLTSFVQETKKILEHGLELSSPGKSFQVRIHSIICDAPARAFICNIKGHTGYFGCGKCVQEGSYVENRVVFPETESAVRTNESFRSRQQEDHHLGDSILEELQFNIVDQIPFEYMHLVCLGVTRKLLNLWLKGKVSKIRLPASKVREISSHLITLKPYIPEEFARKTRALQFIDTWKATEFRLFLLYTGPVVLKAVLPPAYYDHFMTLNCAIQILCNNSLYLKYNQYANDLLKYFTFHFATLYGPETLSYNIHGLVHLASDCKHLGPLDAFSAFKFENHLGHIKSLLKSSSRPLEQVYCRLVEGQEHRQGRTAVESHYVIDPFPSTVSCNHVAELTGKVQSTETSQK